MFWLWKVITALAIFSELLGSVLLSLAVISPRIVRRVGHQVAQLAEARPRNPLWRDAYDDVFPGQKPTGFKDVIGEICQDFGAFWILGIAFTNLVIVTISVLLLIVFRLSPWLVLFSAIMLVYSGTVSVLMFAGARGEKAFNVLTDIIRPVYEPGTIFCVFFVRRTLRIWYKGVKRVHASGSEWGVTILGVALIVGGLTIQIALLFMM